MSTAELISLCKERGLKGYSKLKKDDLVKLLEKGNVNEKSVLRFPGGKSRGCSILFSYVEKYYPDSNKLISPFVGGGSFELFMREKGYKVYANDLFTPLITFWKVLQEEPVALALSVEKELLVDKEKFMKMRQEILELDDEMKIATYYFIINRCSFSGATFCGGFSKEAALNRCNKSSIEKVRTTDISGIDFYNLDYAFFLQQVKQDDKTVIYCDPPYYIKNYIYGRDGDLHKAFDHAEFAKVIKSKKNWILSYNDCPYIRELYKDCRIFEESWSYGMNKSKESSEIVILP